MTLAILVPLIPLVPLVTKLQLGNELQLGNKPFRRFCFWIFAFKRLLEFPRKVFAKRMIISTQPPPRRWRAEDRRRPVAIAKDADRMPHLADCQHRASNQRNTAPVTSCPASCTRGRSAIFRNSRIAASN